MAESSGRSPWFYVTIGCGGILLIFAVAVGALMFIGFRTFKTIKDEMSDPVARTARAQRLLGADPLPEGYHVGPTISVPLLFEMAILADRPPGSDGDLAEDTERMFIYFKALRGGRQWSDYVEGKADPFEMLEQQGFELSRGDRVAKAEIAVGEQQILYLTERGSFASDDLATDDALLTLMFIRCPEDKKLRIGVWIASDPDANLPIDEVDFAGTVADPEQVRAFMSGLQTCQG